MEEWADQILGQAMDLLVSQVVEVVLVVTVVHLLGRIEGPPLRAIFH